MDSRSNSRHHGYGRRNGYEQYGSRNQQNYSTRDHSNGSGDGHFGHQAFNSFHHFTPQMIFSMWNQKTFGRMAGGQGQASLTDLYQMMSNQQQVGMMQNGFGYSRDLLTQTPLWRETRTRSAKTGREMQT
jgi:hypothetical protein